jgi:cytochrome b561
MVRNTDHSWGAPAKLLHWAIAALVFAQFALGWAAVSWRLSPTKLDLFVWHKSTGMLILALMVIRVAWRSANVAPSPPADMRPLERRTAHASHLLLYLVLLLMPMTGWIVNSAANIPFRMFWLIPVPAIVEPDKAMADAAARVHFVLFVVLSLLLAVHIGAALRHHFVKRNDVLVRMLPGRGGIQ